MKKVFPLLLTIFCFLLFPLFVNATDSNEIWSGTSDTNFDGSGTKEDPYQISSAEELAGFIELISINENQSYQTAHYIITTDIYLNDTNNYTDWKKTPPKNIWVSYLSVFCGELNGNNHSIHGMYCNGTSTGFSFIRYAPNAYIHDLTIDYSYINSNHAASAGFVSDTIFNEEAYHGSEYDSLVIENCTFSGEIYCPYQCGGIGGTLPNSTIIGCKTRGNFYGIEEISGICVEATSIVNCKNYANLSAIKHSAGISPSCDQISNCKNYGNILSEGNASEIAGISINTTTLSDCTNYGNISSKGSATKIGGVCSYLKKITNCSNRGKITVYGSAKLIGGVAAIGDSYLCAENGSIKKCINRGNITCYKTAQNIGGIAGSGHNISLCKNYGQLLIKGIGSNIGGIAGNIEKGTLNRCFNKGKILLKKEGKRNTSSGIGGIIGSTAYTYIYNCRNDGAILGNMSDVGGICGSFGVFFTLNPDESNPSIYVKHCNITNCNNNGKISTSGGSAGGICGNIWGGLSYCINSGSISSQGSLCGGMVAVPYYLKNNHALHCYSVSGKVKCNGQPRIIGKSCTASKLKTRAIRKELNSLHTKNLAKYDKWIIKSGKLVLEINY